MLHMMDKYVPIHTISSSDSSDDDINYKKFRDFENKDDSLPDLTDPVNEYTIDNYIDVNSKIFDRKIDDVYEIPCHDLSSSSSDISVIAESEIKPSTSSTFDRNLNSISELKESSLFNRLISNCELDHGTDDGVGIVSDELDSPQSLEDQEPEEHYFTLIKPKTAKENLLSVSEDDELPDINVNEDNDFGVKDDNEPVIPSEKKENSCSVDCVYLAEDPLTNARSFATRLFKKEDCMKSVKVVIDERLLGISGDSCKTICADKLDSLGDKLYYEKKLQPMANVITWERIYNDMPTKKWIAENQVLTILQVDEFLPMIENFTKSNSAEGTIKEFCDTIRAHYPNKKITIAICTLRAYFKKQSAKKNREFRNNVLGMEASQPKRKKKNEINITQVDLEEVIVDLMVNCPDCNLRFINGMSDLPEIIFQFTKSIAQIPFKKTQGEDYSWYLDGDGKRSVKVDKTGKQITDLWLVQIQSFINVGLESAEAIVAKYPTPASLINAYKKCRTFTEAQLLLQDLMIRRRAGPITTSRRIGPDLSKKIHAFLTFEDADTLLNDL